MKINRNILWSENFFGTLANLGVKYVCISPGSRSTPLTLAVSSNRKFKCFVHIDERSSGFFALGIAKATGKPVIIITTSGTATAELFPAIIEAYQQRISLIVCTADRPPELIGRGANQTINQINIYHNHIRLFKDAGLPSPSIAGIKKISQIAEEVFIKCKEGPVHINFPFRKPFEPDSFTDDIEYKQLKLIGDIRLKEFYPLKEEERIDQDLSKKIIGSINDAKRGLIIAGPLEYDKQEKSYLLKLSERLNFPVLADASSQLRFGRTSKKNLVINYEGFLRNKYFINNLAPDLVLQFGSTPSSKAIEIFLDNIKTRRFIINQHADIFDPWMSANGILKCSTSLFFRLVQETFTVKKYYDTKWMNDFLNAEILSKKIKEKILNDSSFPNECRIIPEIINSLPDGVQLMISNSMPVRDFDYFAPVSAKEIIVHTNRGASGIDGIVSTALGIQKSSQRPTLLITGDLAFYYDLNSLLTANKYKIPLVVILINNNGGGIFGMLPVSKYKKRFTEYFISPHNLDFASIVKSFKGKYKQIKSWNDLRKSIVIALNERKFSVLEIKTEIKRSVNLRKKYFREADKIIGRHFS